MLGKYTHSGVFKSPNPDCYICFIKVHQKTVKIDHCTTHLRLNNAMSNIFTITMNYFFVVSGGKISINYIS